MLCVVLLLAIIPAAAGCANGTKEPSVNLPKVSEFEGGRLYKAGNIFVAQLNGDYKVMGRQYGGLLKTQIKKFYDEAIDGFFSTHQQLSRGKVGADLISRYAIYPARVRKIFEGMRETIGLTLEQLVMIDNAAALPIAAGDLQGCSMAGAWKEYTGGGPLVYGRSFDYASYTRNYNDTLSVVVYNPVDGSRSTATLVNAGQVRTINAFNDARLVMAINMGTISGGQGQLKDTMPTLVDNLTFMFDSSNLETLIAELKTARPLLALIFNAADTARACSLEETTTQYRERDGKAAGLLVATNHFLEPTWNLPATSTAEQLASPLLQNSVARYENLSNLCEKNKGKIDASTMKGIFDTPTDKGGPVQQNRTIYEFVTVPSELQLWVKAYGDRDWALVPLGDLFN